MKRSPIRRQSKARSGRMRLYVKARKEHLEEFPICQVCENRNSSEIHHKKGRLGPLLYDKRFFLAVDDVCHTTIELNRSWAMKNKFSLDRLSI